MSGRRPGDGGAAATEYMSMIGLFLFVLVICFEAYVAFTVAEKVEDAARTGARVGSMRGAGAGQRAAEQVMPGWINEHTVRVNQRTTESVECEIWAKVPLLAKGVPFDVEIRRRVEMPIGG